MPAYTYEMIKENDRLPAFFRTAEVADMTIPAHWHQYVEIVYLTAGKMTAVIQAETYELEAGDMLIINSGDIHMTQTHGEKTCYLLLQISASQLGAFFPDFHLLHFDTVISPSIQEKNYSDTNQLSVQTSQSAIPANITTVGHYMTEIYSIFDRKEDGYPLLFSARLHELLYYLYRNHSTWLPDKKTDGNFSQILQTLEWIQSHYKEPLTLTKASAHLGFSREYFCRLFKKYTGQTFLEYVGNIRAMKFYEDLKESEESITMLMEKHGITNYKVFLQTFRKLYGSTPQKVRSRK